MSRGTLLFLIMARLIAAVLRLLWLIPLNEGQTQTVAIT